MKTMQTLAAIAIMMAFGAAHTTVNAQSNGMQRGGRTTRQEMMVTEQGVSTRGTRPAEGPAQAVGTPVRTQPTTSTTPVRTSGQGRPQAVEPQRPAAGPAQVGGPQHGTGHGDMHTTPQRTGATHVGGAHPADTHMQGHHTEPAHHGYDIRGYEDRVRHMDDGRWSYYREGQWHCYDHFIEPCQYYERPLSHWGAGVVVAGLITLFLAALMN